MTPETLRKWVRRAEIDGSYGVYEVRGVWRQLRREGTPVARCTVARLMRKLGLRGLIRGKTWKTTRPDASAQRPDDLADRQFTVNAPNRLWMADLTDVRTWAGIGSARSGGGAWLPLSMRTKCTCRCCDLRMESTTLVDASDKVARVSKVTRLGPEALAYRLPAFLEFGVARAHPPNDEIRKLCTNRKRLPKLT